MRPKNVRRSNNYDKLILTHRVRRSGNAEKEEIFEGGNKYITTTTIVGMEANGFGACECLKMFFKCWYISI